MDELRELMDEYAEKLQTIYVERTAGDYTFTGVLYEFLTEAERIRRVNR